jgi:hypothetical protein
VRAARRVRPAAGQHPLDERLVGLREHPEDLGPHGLRTARGLAGGGRLEQHRGEPLPDDRPQQLALRGGARGLAHDLDGHAQRRDQLGEARRARPGRQGWGPDPAARHGRHERDVGERGAGRRDELGQRGLELRRAGVEVGEDVRRAEHAEDRARGVLRVGGRVLAHDDVGPVGRLGGGRGVRPGLRQRVVAAHRDPGGAQVAREAAAGLAEAEERDRRHPGSLMRAA